MQPESLPSYEALDELVDGDPIALRDVAWQLRNRVAAYERLETAARAWRRKKYGPAPVRADHQFAFSENELAIIAAVDALPAPEVTP
jgi:hypothetical protein